MTLLTLKDLSLSIGGTEILKKVNLTIAPGKILGIIGESGSGKSMTAYSILRLLPDRAELNGSIRFDGHEMTSLSEPELCDLRGNDIGMIFQEPMTALNPVKTIGDQIAETILIHENTTKAAAFARVHELMERVDLPIERFSPDRFPHELSGGQRQRVVIAMAIAKRPKLLIADEPTTALDVTTQARILTLLKRLVEEDGMALLMITHDLAVISEMADDMVIMKHGEVVEAGPARDVFTQQNHPYTRALIAASGHIPNRSERRISSDTLLNLSHVNRDYPIARASLFAARGTFRAVNNVSFEIKRGESLGLVGESGCGKTTLTKAILGLDPVQSGMISLEGAPVYQGRSSNRDVRRKMQVVFQDPYGSFNPRHTVTRLICEPFFLLDSPPTGAERETAIAEALTSVGLSPSDAEKYIHEFSGGQRQRIAIARALIIKPELIVLDEAVSALDVSIRAQILDLLTDLSSRFGITYLFISHDLSVVRAITDRVLVMKSGEIVEQGDTDQVFENPRHPYTKALIAAAPTLPDYATLRPR